jgi:hypothetical protein
MDNLKTLRNKKPVDIIKEIDLLFSRAKIRENDPEAANRREFSYFRRRGDKL